MERLVKKTVYWHIWGIAARTIPGRCKSKGNIETGDCVSKEEFKKKNIENKIGAWKEKINLGQFLTDMV